MPHSLSGSEVTSPTLANLLACGTALAVLFSTRYLAQPFIWTNWSVPEVLSGWLEIFWGRLAVGLCMALSLWVLLRGPGRRRVSALRATLALIAGAACGELALLALDAPDAAATAVAVVGRLLRWTAVIVVIVALHRLWSGRHAEELAHRAADERRQQTESQLLRVRLLALQAQIEPHFLFNTLATVQHLARTRRELGLRLLDHLIAFVRLSAQAAPDSVPWTVKQELDLVRAYLGVIEMRMGGRLRVRVETDELAGAMSFPPLLLATLVENAVKHGIGPVPEGGTIDVQVSQHEANLTAEVSDTGRGFVGQSGSGIGLANSRARLRTLYGTTARLELAVNEPHGVVARLLLPARSSICAS